MHAIDSLPGSPYRPAGVLKVIDLKKQKQPGGKGKAKGKGKSGKQDAATAPAVTGAQALKALLQPAAADVGGGAGLPAWD